MKLQTVRLRKFKRFDDLTIDLGPSPAKVVALVGPNGCGKSSVFDAFEQVLQNYVSVNNVMPETYYNKTLFDVEGPSAYSKQDAIQISPLGENALIGRVSFYVRTAYRFTPALQVSSIQQRPDPVTDSSRPSSSSSLDQRLLGNYERMLGQLLSDFFIGENTGKQVRDQLVGSINTRLTRILDVQISNLGDVTQGKGQLFFTKGSSVNFPFENLSAGEKEVVDLIIDLEVKRKIYSDTVYCIDEPELHLNTAIQRRLLKELADLVPEGCQLWVATHSIGFLRALQQDLAGQSQIIDFSSGEYFAGSHTVHPVAPTRANWRRIFSTALEDLTGLIAPRTIVYCEGRARPAANGRELGFDARAYNQIFESETPDVLFVSAGGGQEPKKYSDVAIKILEKAFDDVRLVLLKDRDDATDDMRIAFISASSMNRMLERREIENYLFDAEVLRRFCEARGIVLNLESYDNLVTDIRLDDLKLGQTMQRLAQLCGHRGSLIEFKAILPSFVCPDTTVYQELKRCVFPS